VEEPVLDALGVDVIELGRGFMLEESDWKDWVLPDGTPCKIPYYINIEKRGGDTYIVSDQGKDLAVQVEGCVFFEQASFPLADHDFENDDFSEIVKAFDENMWTGTPTPGGHFPLDDEGLKRLEEGAKKLRESTDRAIMGLFGGNLFEVPQFLYRMDNYLTYMGLYPEACIRLSEELCGMYLKRLEKWLGAVGPYIDVILFGDDLGGQNGPLMSRTMYCSYYKPYHSKMWKRAKELADVNVHLHSCGGIEPLLDDLIDAGLDSTNPVQISCKGMDPRNLKDKYGGRITFWGGGCDTHAMLPQGTPEDIAGHVRENVRIFSPGGGFVFQQVHNILSEIPPENIIAMFEAVNG
jgi:uroporphyrinogen decarboxylase